MALAQVQATEDTDGNESGPSGALQPSTRRPCRMARAPGASGAPPHNTLFSYQRPRRPPEAAEAQWPALGSRCARLSPFGKRQAEQQQLIITGGDAPRPADHDHLFGAVSRSIRSTSQLGLCKRTLAVETVVGSEVEV
jgi:hypothetical protein